MIGLDTNVVVAWLLEGRSRLLQPNKQYRVTQIVLLELEWVMRTRLRLDRDTVVSLFNQLLDLSDLAVDRADVVQRAVADYAKGGADFADFLIVRDNEAAGCRETLTLDRKAARKPGFSLLQS